MLRPVRHERIPADATPSDIALHLSLLAPVTGERHVDVAEGLASLGVPPEAAAAVAEVYAEHGRQVAAELSEIVRTLVWPPFREAGGTAEQLREMVHRLKPLTVVVLDRPPTDVDEPRWAFATSGSTGSPKAALHTDRGLLVAGHGFALHGQMGRPVTTGGRRGLLGPWSASRAVG